MGEEAKQTAFHWFVVGYVSPGAEAWIKNVGGQVLHLDSTPRLVAVALAYNPAGAWTWSHGERQHRQGIEFWNIGEIQEASTGITLQYRSTSDTRTVAEYSSCESNYLILPDEEFDITTGKVKEPDPDQEVPEDTSRQELPSTSFLGDSNLEDLDDYPF
jgi:hypothetical protein